MHNTGNSIAQPKIPKIFGCVRRLGHTCVPPQYMCVLFLLLSVILTSTTALHASSQDRQQSSTQTVWTMDNGLVRRQLSFSNTSGLLTTSWKNLVDGKEFIDPSLDTMSDYCHEFRFEADGHPYTGTATDFNLIGARQHIEASGDRMLDLSLSSKDGRVEVVAHYVLPNGMTAVRQYLTIRNVSNTPVTLTHLTIACAAIEPAKPANLIAYGGYGEQPREIFFTGRADDVAILLENAITGDGVASLSEVPGYLKRAEVGVLGKWYSWQPGISLMYDTDLVPFEQVVAPNQVFNTAAVSFLLYRRGTSQDPHWLIPTYVSQIIARPTAPRPPEWMYNTWEPFHKTVNSKELIDVEKKAAEMGLGIFVIDDGWEQMYGDNTVDTHKFSEGLEPELKLAQKSGMQFGLWSPVALISKNAPVYKNHPEWACHDRNGQPKLSQGAGVVMDLTSPYKDAVFARLSDLIRKYHLGYIKLDFTTAFNAYGEEPGCYETVAGQKSRGTSYIGNYEALDEIAGRLHSQFPGLLIDYTFELWGKKELIDYGLIKYADLDWMSNVQDHGPTDAGSKAARDLLYQRAMVMPVETMLIGNLQAEAGPWEVQAATEMGSYPLLLGDLRKLSPADVVHYREWVSRFRSLRSRVPLNQSFFPLGSWRQPRSNAWDGFARFARTGEGIVVLFRNDSVARHISFQIPGFPDGDYKMTSWTSNNSTSANGPELRAGYSVVMDSGPVTILELTKPER